MLPDVLDFAGDSEPERERERDREEPLLPLSCLLREMPGSVGGGAQRGE